MTYIFTRQWSWYDAGPRGQMQLVISRVMLASLSAATAMNSYSNDLKRSKPTRSNMSRSVPLYCTGRYAAHISTAMCLLMRTCIDAEAPHLLTPFKHVFEVRSLRRVFHILRSGECVLVVTRPCPLYLVPQLLRLLEWTILAFTCDTSGAYGITSVIRRVRKDSIV